MPTHDEHVYVTSPLRAGGRLVEVSADLREQITGAVAGAAAAATAIVVANGPSMGDQAPWAATPDGA